MITLNYLEEDIEDFLKKGINLETYLGLKFINSQVPIDKYFIDILAYNKKEKCFYIIELKKNDINSKAFTQGLKYLNLMQWKYPTKNFKLLLIGNDLNEDLYYCVKFYDEFKENNAKFLYTIFQIDLTKGIGFNYFNKIQRLIENSLRLPFKEIKND